MEGQSVLCLSYKISCGQNYPCLCNLPFPHILAAARLTMDPQSPLRAQWHLRSSFGHAMENNPGELREKGDMEIPVRAPAGWSSE